MFFDTLRLVIHRVLIATAIVIHLALPSFATAEIACKLSSDNSQILIGYNSEIACGTFSVLPLIPGVRISVSDSSDRELLNDRLQSDIQRTYYFTAGRGTEKRYGLVLACFEISGPVPCHRAIRVPECIGSAESCSADSREATTPSFLVAPPDKQVAIHSVLP